MGTGAAPSSSFRWKRWARLIVGWAFIVLGIAGLVLPILQGFLFLAIGFAVLAPESTWAQRQLDRLRRRHPELAATFDRAAERAAAWIARFSDRVAGK